MALVNLNQTKYLEILMGRCSTNLSVYNQEQFFRWTHSWPTINFWITLI